jgi:hypothetical protein
MSNRHHRDYDYIAIVSGSLSQKGIEALSFIYSNHREAQHREYMAHHYSINVSDLVAKVIYLKAAFNLSLHTMRASLCKACHHLGSGREVVN